MKKQLVSRMLYALMIVMLVLAALPVTLAYAGSAGPNDAGTGANAAGVGTLRLDDSRKYYR